MYVMAHNINDMNITLNTTVRAFNKHGNPLKDFNPKCYAQDVNVTYSYDINSSDYDANLTLDGNLTSGDVDISDINKTLQIPKERFVAGEANSSYAFGIDRAYNVYKNSKNVEFKEANVTTTGISKYQGGKTFNTKNTATFYYGRVKTKDIDTNKQSVQHSLDIEVYSAASLSNFHQNSLSWYSMKDDNITKIVDFLPKKDFTMSTTKSGINDINSTQSVANGIVRFTITNSWSSPDSAYIHIKIPLYLWYSRYNAYDDNSSSDCGKHPCFKYNYLLGNDQKNIKSGDFNGTSIGSDYNASKVSKKGVKVFR